MPALTDFVGTRLESLAVVHPERARTTDELIAEMVNEPAFDLVALTGVEARRWRAEHETSLSLALDAARDCLARSSYEAADLDVIISASITRFTDPTYFQLEPGMAKAIKDEIGGRPDALNLDLGNACAGMMSALHALDHMIRSGAVRRGMVVSGECITPIAEAAQREISEPIDDQFASLTVGDSGVAVILDGSDAEGSTRLRGMDFVSIGALSELCLGMPSERGSGVVMYTKAVELHLEAITRIPDLMKHFKDKWGLHESFFDYVIPHQTSARAIETAMEKCAEHFDPLPEVCGTLDLYGNTSSTSHFVVLDHYLRNKEIPPGSNILLLVLASGLVLGVAVITLGSDLEV